VGTSYAGVRRSVCVSSDGQPVASLFHPPPSEPDLHRPRALGSAPWGPRLGVHALGSTPWGHTPWGQTEFQVNLKLGLTSHACIQSPGHSQDGPSNHAPTRSVCTAAAVASLRARFSHSCGINVSLASLGRYARTCERYHGLFSPGSRPTGSSQTLSASPTGLRARWACGLMVLGATKC
jgi:hypothetical protein